MFKRLMALLLALILMIPAAAVAETKNLSKNGSMIVGSEGDEVAAAQQLLKNYGYFDGSVDGVFGKDTEAAVKDFQKRNSLPVDGMIGKLTKAKLESGNVVKKDDPSTGINANTAEHLSTDGNMVSGTTGEAVKEVQTILAGLGYYTGPVDGRYGELTIIAVKAFQRKNGLTADGKVGPKTYEKLTDGSALAKNDGTTAPSPDSKGLSPNGSMVLGSSGTDVMNAQQKLMDYGYYNGLLDGKFSYTMKAAVEAFQRRNGLTVDGKIGPRTLAALYDDPANIVKRTDPDPALDTQPITYGMSGDAVRQLQRALKNYFYYSGMVDGIFGPEVLTAVKSFQESTGLTPDGTAGYQTQDALFNGTAAIFNGAIPMRAMYSGSQGYDVFLVQQRLSNFNYLNLNTVTLGLYDAGTKAAVAKFQQDKGLEPTGNFTDNVRRYLWTSEVEAEDQAIVADENSKLDPYDQLFDPYLGDTLRQGSAGDQVANAQMKLKAAGYLQGNADGVFGPKTTAAVKRLQKDYGLKEDGVIGQSTWAIIRGLSVDAAQQKVVIDGKTSVGASTKVLSRGSRGSQVVKLQTKLNELGYNCGAVDGKFGPATAVAVSQFQLDNGLNPDGVVGTDTFVALKIDYNAEPVVLPTTPSTPETYTDTKIPDTMKRGNKGNYVKKLQQKLADLGLYTGEIDGKFGDSTLVAVKQFQLSQGINPDGVAGKKTLVALGLIPDSVASAKLRRGSKGDSVETLQEKLTALGLYTGKIDGKFGADTEKAVKTFQETNGLKPDGIVGPATKAKLGL